MTVSEEKYIKQLEKELKVLREQNSSQTGMFEMTTTYLKKIQDDLRISKLKLAETNKDLTDSINFAKHIQDSLVLHNDYLRILFPNSFTIQKPKDILSGDFTWAFEKNDLIYLCTGDCTGHGVPGAMLSIFMISMLNQVVSQYENLSPAFILKQLDAHIHKYLSQKNDQIQDSAEIAFIKFDKNNQTLCFSGAKRPLIQIRNKIITSYHGSKYVLGDPDRRIEEVENKTIEVQKNDMIYMFSDGFADQFGGERNRKFSSKKLLELLKDVSELPIEQQQNKIETTYQNWKGENSQIDDVLVMGIRI